MGVNGELLCDILGTAGHRVKRSKIWSSGVNF